MSLTNCKDCGKEVSTNASSCPNCGSPIKKDRKKNRKEVGTNTSLIVISGFVLFIIFVYIGVGPSKDVSNDNGGSSESYSPSFKMQQVFVGGYSKADIERELDKAIKKFDKRDNEKSKMEIGDLLIHLRRKYDIHEVKLLRCANESSENYTFFKEAVSLCVARME